MNQELRRWGINAPGPGISGKVRPVGTLWLGCDKGWQGQGPVTLS